MTERGSRGVEVERTPIAQLHVDMARHSIKGKLPDGREPLTEEGMKAAVQSRTGTIREVIGNIFGSPRERTGQSSALRMFADQFKEVDFAGVDPEDIVRWLQEGGLKKTETPFLDFQGGEGEYNKQCMAEFKAKNLLKWLYEKSEQVALETVQHPDKVTPLPIQAGNVASFVFGEVWGQYDRLWKGETGKPQGVDFATSHQGVLESFLTKVIERKEGHDAAIEFIASLGNEGFKENEGYKLDIAVYDKNNTDAWTATITYKDKQYVLESRDITAIIAEGQELKGKLVDRYRATHPEAR